MTFPDCKVSLHQLWRPCRGAVVRHRHRLGALANRLRGSGEPGDGIEEGMMEINSR